MCARRPWARLLPLLAAAVTLAAPAASETFVDQRVLRDLQTGLICPAGNAEKVPAPDTMLGHVKRREAWQKIVYSTRKVPMLRNLGFGFNIQPNGPRLLEPVTVRVIHPAYKNTDVTVESWSADLAPGRSNLNYFVFEYGYEMVPGTWTFQIDYDGRRIMSVDFTVVPPEQFPGFAGLCDGDLIAAL